jgi:hypothetical protein
VNISILLTLTACLPLVLGFATAQRSPAPAPAVLSVRTVSPLTSDPQLIPNKPDDVAGCVWYYFYGWRLACEMPMDPNSEL